MMSGHVKGSPLQAQDLAVCGGQSLFEGVAASAR